MTKKYKILHLVKTTTLIDYSESDSFIAKNKICTEQNCLIRNKSKPRYKKRYTLLRLDNIILHL